MHRFSLLGFIALVTLGAGSALAASPQPDVAHCVDRVFAGDETSGDEVVVVVEEEEEPDCD